jgi:tRNA modification GTPase
VDVVEEHGVHRARDLASKVDVMLLVVDASVGRDCEFEKSIEAQQPGQKLLKVFSKMDLLDDRQRELIVSVGGGGVNSTAAFVSTVTGEGMDRLRENLARLVSADASFAEGNVQVTTRRHVEALSRASASLALARTSIASGATNEFVAFDVRQAIDALSEITGEVTSEEILNNIFGRFCIGK